MNHDWKQLQLTGNSQLDECTLCGCLRLTEKNILGKWKSRYKRKGKENFVPGDMGCFDTNSTKLNLQ